MVSRKCCWGGVERNGWYNQTYTCCLLFGWWFILFFFVLLIKYFQAHGWGMNEDNNLRVELFGQGCNRRLGKKGVYGTHIPLTIALRKHLNHCWALCIGHGCQDHFKLSWNGLFFWLEGPGQVNWIHPIPSAAWCCKSTCWQTRQFYPDLWHACDQIMPR